MSGIPDEDVPSPIDFHDPAQVRAWIADTVVRRPYRPKFFGALAEALNAFAPGPLRLLELGSGPGHLAEHVLANCRVAHYAALDFSAAMHDAARERLASWLDRVALLERDFRDAGWAKGLEDFDAVLTMQAAHETRHKRHLKPLLSRAAGTLRAGGVMLYCDHYVEAGTDKNPALYAERDEQPAILADVGFRHVARLHEEGGMALYRGLRA